MHQRFAVGRRRVASQEGHSSRTAPEQDEERYMSASGTRGVSASGGKGGSAAPSQSLPRTAGPTFGAGGGVRSAAQGAAALTGEEGGEKGG